MLAGKLIVLEGIDGSGKNTQINLLRKKIPCEVISFPRYGNNEYTAQIESYLKGEKDFDPETIARAYAGDRQLAKPIIEKWLKEGKLVIANRYTSANIAHLGIDLKVDMPKPVLTILLDVDPKKGQENALKLQKADIHEHDLAHLEKARIAYLELAKSEPNWMVINCMKNAMPAGRQGSMKSPEEIQKEIVKLLQSMVLSRL